MNTLRSFWNSPIGPKTTHFWGPTFNWSLPIAVTILTILILRFTFRFVLKKKGNKVNDFLQLLLGCNGYSETTRKDIWQYDYRLDLNNNFIGSDA